MPINIERQRALARIGKIRLGDRKPDRGAGKTRTTWRLTSPNKLAIEQVQAVYGGTVSQWEGQWELLSDTATLSVMIDTRMSLDEGFEQYNGKTRTHDCDGLHCNFREIVRRGDKILSCSDVRRVQCLCDPRELGAALPDEERKCDTRTSLRVILPCTEDLCLWQFDSKSLQFNREVNGTLDSLRAIYDPVGVRHGYCLLTIQQRKSTVGDSVKHWSVAVLSMDPNPPDLVKTLLSRTPSAQSQRSLGTGDVDLPALTEGAKSLPDAGNTSHKAELLPLPHGFIETHETALSMAKNLYVDRGWVTQDPELKKQEDQIAAISVELGFYKPALILMAHDQGCSATKQDIIDFLMSYGEHLQASQVAEVVQGVLVEE